MSNPAVLVGLFTLAGVIVSTLVQMIRDGREHAHQLERDKRVEAHAFRMEHYRRLREAGEQLCASTRNRFAAVRAVKANPRESNEAADAAMRESNQYADAALRVLSVETNTQGIRQAFTAAQYATNAYAVALGAAEPYRRASDDEIRRLENEVLGKQRELELAVADYLAEREKALGLA